MEIGAAAAGVTAGVHALWGYNRKNFMYDREMRQKNEFKVLEWRAKQAKLWREDVKDIIGLTEKKMDTYTIVSALQLGMCVALFTEGRLAPGTPPWLIHFYMLTLAAAFLYLLMSVWLAMHASIVASCSEVRLLTQFVRLPIPTWEHLEDMRTYAQSYEHVGGRHMLRVPFLAGTRPPAANGSPELANDLPEDADEQQCGVSALTQSPSAVASATAASSEPAVAPVSDPWGLETHGHHRDLYELQQVPAALRRHVGLAQRAAEQYKCFDAFARVSMTFGTNQLLQALTYYCLGYVAVQDGAPWAAWCIGLIMATISVAMVHLDVALKRREQLTAQVLAVSGPVLASAATYLFSRDGKESLNTVLMLLPFAYASHGLWLLWALRATGVERMPGGAVLPTRFRAVLYLDVFGWLAKDKDKQQALTIEGLRDLPKPRDAVRAGKQGYKSVPTRRTFEEDMHAARGVGAGSGGMASERLQPEEARLAQLRDELQENIALWQSQRVQSVMSEHEKDRINKLAQRFQEATRGEVGSSNDTGAESSRAAPARVRLHGYSDTGIAAPYLYDPNSGEMSNLDEEPPQGPDQPHVRTITLAEEEFEQYCNSRAASSRATNLRGRASSRERRLPAEAFGGRPSPRHMGPAQSPLSDTVEQAQGPFTCCTPTGGKEHEVELMAGHAGHLEEIGRGPGVPYDQVLEEEAVKQEPRTPLQKRRTRDAQSHTGPSGARQHAPDDAFHPTSYAPMSQEAASLKDVVTGHDRMAPGEVPWKVFRSATLMLASLWLIGLAIPFQNVRDMMTRPLTVEVIGESVEDEAKGGVKRFAIGTDPSGLPEYIPEPDEPSLPELPEGELVRATWPSHSGFKPRALSSAPFGKQLVIADDFGVYAGQLQMEFAFQEDPAEHNGRALRGSPRAEPVPSVHFKQAPPCTALEGQALKDISVICSQGSCRVLVLHAHGRRLVLCPLENEQLGSGDGGSTESGAAPITTAMGSEQNMTWVISEDWLYSDHARKKERVESVAVNNECNGGGFSPVQVGCVVVGTTSGRLVQLRGHLTNQTQLVPERAVSQWSEAVEHGSLYVFPNGLVVALRKGTPASIHAFDAHAGSAIGQWRLPTGTDWLMLSGDGGESFYALGQVNETEIQLYRFPVPPELWALRDQAARNAGHFSS